MTLDTQTFIQLWRHPHFGDRRSMTVSTPSLLAILPMRWIEGFVLCCELAPVMALPHSVSVRCPAFSRQGLLQRGVTADTLPAAIPFASIRLGSRLNFMIGVGFHTLHSLVHGPWPGTQPGTGGDA